MARIEVNIAVKAEYMTEIELVAERCIAAGLRVASVLAGIGVITGYIDVSQLISLRAVEGVDAVEQSREIRIAPPDEDLQ